MRAGQLTQRITIQTFTETPDEYGESVKAWVDLASVWAEVKTVSGSEFATSEKLRSTEAIEVTIRYRTDVSRLNRIVHDGQYYNITAAFDPYHKRDQLKLQCVNVVDE